MSETSAPNRLFVYGTLRRSIGHAMHRWLARHADYEGAATFQGILYDLGSYPGVLPSSNPADRVIGEVYRLHAEAHGHVLRQLDAYEDYDPANVAASQYRRERRPIVMASGGQTVQAWIYLYQRSTRHTPRIIGGDYVTYRR